MSSKHAYCGKTTKFYLLETALLYGLQKSVGEL